MDNENDKLLGSVDKGKLDRESDPTYKRIREKDRIRAQEKLLSEAAQRHRKLQKNIVFMCFLLLVAGGIITYHQREQLIEWLGLNEKEVADLTPREPREVAHARNNIVIVQGVPISETYASYQEGGTGFLAKWKDKVFLVTNIHVLAGLEDPHFLTVSGHEIPVNLDNVYLAQNEDVAIVEIPDFDTLFADSYPGQGSTGEIPEKPTTTFIYEPFNIADDVDFIVKEDDPIIIYGNTMGKRIVEEKTGRVEGLGPNIIKHSANTKPGNSGSPIIHRTTDTVIGIDTYSVYYRNGKTQGESYGYRLDTIEGWQPIGTWSRFQSASKDLAEIETRTGDLILLAKGKVDPSNYKDTTFQNIWFTFFNRLRDIYSNRTVSSHEQLSQNEKAYRSYQHFLQSVRSLLYQDIKEFTDPRTGTWTYNYFRIRALSEEETRKHLETAINTAINDYDRVIGTMN